MIIMRTIDGIKRRVIPMKATSHAESPNPVKRTVSRGRLPNAHYRQREYLTEREVERLMKAAGNNRHGHRDATMLLMAFRHGLRASELCSLRWEQADLVHGRLHVHRLKNGMPSVHPLTGIELRALRRLPRRPIRRQAEARCRCCRWLPLPVAPLSAPHGPHGLPRRGRAIAPTPPDA